MTTRIGVVVVAYKSVATIDACVRSILRQSEVSTLVVIDNSPDDGVRAKLVVDHRLRYIHQPANPGFARGCNIGAAMLSDHTHIAFVNPDVVLVRPLAELADVERGQRFAIVAGGLASREAGRLRNARVPTTMGREMIKAVTGSRSLVVDDLPYGDCVQVGQLDGALLLLATDTFARLGGFDERFELYYEDVDLCRSAGKIGGCLLVTQLFGLHAGGHSSEQTRGTAYAVGRISRIRFFRKWSQRQWTTTMGLWLIGSVELLTRTLARTSEGGAARRAAYRAELRELLHPGTINCLSRSPLREASRD